MSTTNPNHVQLASIRIIAEDLEPLVRFYETLAATSAQWLTDDFVEIVTPSATVAISHLNRVSSLPDIDVAAGNHSVIYEFLVDDVEDLLATLQTTLGNGLTVVQPPTMMPWGNLSSIIRDPAGTLINLYTPKTPDAARLQQQRQPQMIAGPVAD